MKPDFSGEYILNRPASVLHAAAIESAVMNIEHREPMFRCSAKFVAEGKPLSEFSYELSTEKSDSGLYWDGDVLVFEYRTGPPDPDFSMVWRYELLDGGRRLRASERIRGSGRDQDSIWEFERALIL
jgi:hypothetical protein